MEKRERLLEHDVRERVEEIRRIARDDDEAAHAGADRLYRSVLEEIANGRYNGAEALAKAALEVEEIDFCRFYA